MRSQPRSTDGYVKATLEVKRQIKDAKAKKSEEEGRGECR